MYFSFQTCRWEAFIKKGKNKSAILDYLRSGSGVSALKRFVVEKKGINFFTKPRHKQIRRFYIILSPSNNELKNVILCVPL